MLKTKFTIQLQLLLRRMFLLNKVILRTVASVILLLNCGSLLASDDIASDIRQYSKPMLNPTLPKCAQGLEQLQAEMQAYKSVPTSLVFQFQSSFFPDSKGSKNWNNMHQLYGYIVQAQSLINSLLESPTISSDRKPFQLLAQQSRKIDLSIDGGLAIKDVSYVHRFQQILEALDVVLSNTGIQT